MNLEDLQALVEGEVITASSDSYDEARKIWNGMIDRHPLAIVRCENASDVAHVIRAAAGSGVELAVRGGGHSIPGHSVCDGGLVLDLSRINSVEVDPERRIARVGGGALLGDLDKATRPFNQATPAGAVTHTGVGGLTLGGGFGHLMRKFGLTIDSLIEAEVVLADSRVVRASEQENADLFWALRGGGGNFGVVTEFVFRTHEVYDPYVAIVIHELADAPSALKLGRQVMADNAPDELNWCSFFRLATGFPDLPSGIVGKPALLSLLEWHGDRNAGERVITEITNNLGGAYVNAGTMPFLTLQSFIDEISTHGSQVWTKAGFFAGISDELIEALVASAAQITSARSTLEVLPLGGAVDRVPSHATAFPHREVGYVFNIIGIWEDAAENDRHIAWVRDSYTRLEPFMTGGAYINYMGGEERGGSAAAFGQGYHMERLQKIKRQVDPENLFRGTFNVAPA